MIKIETIKNTTILILSFLFFTLNVFAQADGTLDQTFGNNGIVYHQYDGTSTYNFQVLDNNKMLLLIRKNQNNGNDDSYYLVRLNEDGSIDNAFGDNGAVQFEHTDADTMNCEYYDFATLDDGKILIVEEKDKIRYSHTDSTYTFKYENNLIKLNEDGSFDSNFGLNGRLNIYLSEGTTYTRNLTAVKTTIYNIENIDNGMFYLRGKPDSLVREVRKYDYDGNLVPEFGENGIVTTENITSSDYATFNNNYHNILSDRNGYFYLFGSDIYQHDYKLNKFLPNGSIDYSFASSGILSFSIGNSQDNGYFIFRQMLDSDGNILLAFKSHNVTIPYSYLYRITENGVFDNSFGNNGIKEFTKSDFGGDADAYAFGIEDVLPLPDNDILVLSYYEKYIPFGEDYYEADFFKIAKLTNNGNFNASFGDSGRRTLPNIPEVGNAIFSTSSTFLALKKDDNKILVSSYYRPDINNSEFLLSIIRYNNTRQFHTLHVSGDVSGAWDVDTVYVDGDITIPENSSLSIARGTVVYFTGKYKFDVYGTLTATGEADRIIVFNSPADLPWRGINFWKTDENNQPASSIAYCSFTNSMSYWGDGLGPYYGTLNMNKSTVAVRNSRFYSTTGIYVNGSDAEIYNTEFILTPTTRVDSNSAALFKNCRFDSSGFSINNNSAPIIDSCIFEHGWNGGATVGLYGNNSAPVIKNTIIRENGSGGVYFASSNPVFEFVTIENNTSNYHGGGGYFNKCNAQFKNVIVRGNTSNMYDGYGGGLYFGATNDATNIYQATFNNCLIVQNTSNSRGGGVFFDFGTKATGVFTNCTIADNISGSWAGISSSDSKPVISVNTIVWNNGGNLDFQSGGLYTYSIVQGNYVGQDTASTNLDNVDPLFRDAANGDYHLQSASCGSTNNSPAIDAGAPWINDLVVDCATAGLGSNLSDIGAYGGANNWWDSSVLPGCYYSGEVSGTWDCDTVHVIGDVLVPSGATLTITENVKRVYITGPYQIKVEGALIARGPENERTDLNGDRILFTGSNWHGIYFSNTNDRNEETSVIENCRFDYCDKMDIPYQGGGAILISNSDSVVIKHSVFYSNKAKFGGAVMIDNSDAVISDCYFQSNGYYTNSIQSEGGGAIYVKNSNPILHKLRLIGNKAQSAGAMLLDNSSPVVTNILAVKNSAQNLAGAIHVINSSSPKFVNATVSDNTAATGGAFYLNPNTNTEIINSIMYGDTKPEIYLGGTAEATYSIIDSASSESFFGEGCLDTNPQFKMTIGNYYYLSSTACGDGTNSPAIDAGHPDSLDAVLDCEEGLGTYRADMGFYGGRYSPLVVGIENENEAVPTKFELSQNYPNPFNPTTTIKYTIGVVETQCIASLRVYNILGEEIATLVNERQTPGNYSVTFDARNLSSGVYFYTLRVGDFVATKKMILMK